jgi:hypothetical protein
VAETEGLARAAAARRLPTVISGRPPTTGHGAKLPRRAEQAIAALLVHRSVAEAARAINIKPQTLRLWMQEPAFMAKYAAAACAVFGPAMRLAQQRESDAAMIIKNFSTDPNVPEDTRLKAATYRAGLAQAEVIANLGARLSGMDSGDEGIVEAQVTAEAIPASFYQRLHEIRARFLHAGGQSAIRRIMLVHPVDGRAAGSSVAGQDGRHRWWDPPEGFKKDDLVQDDPTEDNPLEDVGPVLEKAA